MSDDERWWYDNAAQAGDELNEIFDGEDRAHSYRNADRIARDVLLLMAPLLRVDPNYGESDEAREKLTENLVRVSELARLLYVGETVDQNEIHGGRFVMTCLEPVGPAAAHVLLGVRYALSTLAITQVSAVFEEMWPYPGPEAWCLAVHAYEELLTLQEVDNSEQDFWVRPDDAVVSLAAAHRISNAIRVAGGGETMSNN